MIAAVGLLAALLAPQDTLGLSPRAREMLDRFVPPVNGQVSVATRFSDDTVWLGEQVELVTATWFPRSLRERLRRQPSLRTPALSGLWSAPASTSPELADTRRVSGMVYDLFVSHQTLFPLGAGVIEAPPAVLSYAVPSSSSFFAPEERQSLASRPARLVVRPIPAALAARLGSGPTARNLALRWVLPAGSVVAGTPLTLDLTVSGQGNVSLWPAPEVAWPVNVRVYAEPTEESIRRPGGIVVGDKRFRFTLVADSAGVLTLPRVRYPYFDPVRGQVVVASAAPVGVAVRPHGSTASRVPVAASSVLRTPLAATLVRGWWPVLLGLALAPLLLVARRRRRPVIRQRHGVAGVEEELRSLLGQPADATPGRVEAALRRRGASRDDARAVRRWLEAVDRHRWSSDHPPRPDDAIVARIIATARQGAGRVVAPLLLLAALAAPMAAQWQEALDRYRNNDAIGAERLFAQVVASHPASPDAWLDLGASRWLAGDDVGSVAAWIGGLRVAPRDGRLRAALDAVSDLPPDVRALAPIVPLSRDELVLVALGGWLLLWAVWPRSRRLGWAAAVLTLAAAGLATARGIAAARDIALVRPATLLRVSPVVTAPELGAVPAWSRATLERGQGGWWLVRLDGTRRGWLPAAQLATLSPLD